MMNIFSKKTILTFIRQLCILLWIVGFWAVVWYNYPSFKDMFLWSIVYLVGTIFVGYVVVKIKDVE